MTWTYDDPNANLKDAIRFLVGDTDMTDQLLQDEEIAYALSVEATNDFAAALCCESLARKFAREADKVVGPLSIKASQKSEAFMNLAIRLRRKGSINAEPYAGGQSLAEKEMDALNTDLPQPIFYRGMMTRIK